MTCQETNNQLDGYIAGELPPEQQTTIEQHISSCPECRLELALRRAVIARTRMLPRELAPQRELWPGIAEQISKKKIHPLYPGHPSWLRRWEAWAAVACVAIIATVWVAANRTEDGINQPTIIPPMAAGNPPHVSAAIGENQHYQHVRQRIQQTLHLSKEEFSPETVSVIERNMEVIDDAVAQINKALSEDPENPNLQLMLVATQQQATTLLESIAEVSTQQPTTNQLEEQPQ